jgi:hypothetical protein
MRGGMLVEAAWALCGLCCIPVFIQSGLESRVQSLNQRPLFALNHPNPPVCIRPGRGESMQDRGVSHVASCAM